MSKTNTPHSERRRQRRRVTLVLVALSHAGTRGHTWSELAQLAGWHHGQASSALSELHSQGAICRVAEKRGRQSVYVLPECVDGRETRPYGRRRPSLTPAERLAAHKLRKWAWEIERLTQSPAVGRNLKAVLDAIDRLDAK